MLKFKSKDFPNDVKITLLQKCGKVSKVSEAKHLKIVHGWNDVEIRAMQQSRKGNKQ